MSWLVIAADGSIAAGPLDTEPQAVGPGETVVLVAIGYPDVMAWDSERRAFVDLVPPAPAPVLSRLDALIARLVAKGHLTEAEAAALPQGE